MHEWIGKSGNQQAIVAQAHTAAAVGSGLLPVFSTPSLVALMEHAAVNALAPFMEKGATSVGIRIDVAHTAATPLGKQVCAVATVTAVEKRKVEFSIEAFDEAGPIGNATHTRVIVDETRFMEKVLAK